jgi:hypothetical protein
MFIPKKGEEGIFRTRPIINEEICGLYKTPCVRIVKLRGLPYLRMYKQHFFDKNLPSKIGCGLYTELKKNVDLPRKSRYHRRLSQ